MLNLKADQYSSVEIALQSNTNEIRVQQQLQKALGKSFTVQTRYQQNQSLFSVMQVEKWVIFGILSLILLIAAFNMIGAFNYAGIGKAKRHCCFKSDGSKQ